MDLKSNFTKENLGEESDEFQIRRDWNQLSRQLALQNPTECVMEINRLKTRPQRAIKFILGSYLSQALKGVRPSDSVFACLYRLILYKLPGEGKRFFSSEEDQVLRKCMESFSSLKSASVQAAIEINREEKSVYDRMVRLKASAGKKQTGRFSLEEDDIILRHFFLKSNVECSVAGIQSLLKGKMSDFKVISETLMRNFVPIFNRWQSLLAPTLLAYHFGCLHSPWRRDLLLFALEKKAVSHFDLKLEEIQEKWPFLTLYCTQVHLLRYFKRQPGSLWKKVEDNLAKVKSLKNHPPSVKRAEDIVKLYTKIMDEKAKQQ